VVGGAVLSRGAVFHILRSQIYLGKIPHKSAVHDGLHDPIVSQALFDAVAAKLAAQATIRRETPTKATPGPLAGKLFDAAGEPMSPSFSYGRGGRLYRYYIALALQTGGRPKEGVIARVSAPAIETFLAGEMTRLTRRTDLTAASLAKVLHRVELHRAHTHLVLDGQAAFPGQHPELALSALKRNLAGGEEAVVEEGYRLRIVLQRRLQLRGGRTHLAGGAAPAPSAGIKQALHRAHLDLAKLKASPLASPSELTFAVAPATQHEREVARLAFLSPHLQARVMDGQHDAELKLRHLLRSAIPLAWSDQEAWFDRLAAQE
jgi:site-specific DNA recombinase